MRFMLLSIKTIRFFDMVLPLRNDIILTPTLYHDAYSIFCKVLITAWSLQVFTICFFLFLVKRFDDHLNYLFCSQFPLIIVFCKVDNHLWIFSWSTCIKCTRCVMAIFVRNKHGDTCSIQRRGCLYFYQVITLWKVLDPTIILKMWVNRWIYMVL